LISPRKENPKYMNFKHLAIGSDHAGYDQKEMLADYLRIEGYEVKDFGPFNNESVDYPDHVHPVARAVVSGDAEIGIVLCGSGNGAAMTANKYPEIRAALCWNEELAALARKHNDANILAIPARFVGFETIKNMLDCFLNTGFEGERHQRRIEKIRIP
jgi:ribose 5-phosphate isomerase B